MSEESLLDARLAEIDRRLRAIQTGLRPVEEPPPAPAPEAVPEAVPEPEAVDEGPPRLEAEAPAPAPEAEEPRLEAEEPAPAEVPATLPALVEELRALGDAHERLLELHRELLAEYASLLERRVVEEPPEPAAGATVSVDAGPFPDGDAVRAFEQALGALPQVTEVAVREYLADDRVVIDVGLAS